MKTLSSHSDTSNAFSKPLKAFLVLFASIILFTAAGASQDATVQNGESIQAAINDASSGDIIEIESGVYDQRFKVNKSSLTLRDAGNDRPVINQSDNDWTAIHVNASDVTLERLKVKNTENDGAERVRGIHGDKYSDGLTITDVVVDDVDGEVSSSRPTGYGMTLSGDSTTVKNSEVKNVHATDFAAGIRLGGDGNLAVENGEIRNVDVSSIDTTTGSDAVGIFLASISSSTETEVVDSKVTGLNVPDDSNNGVAGVYIVSKNGNAKAPDISVESNELSVSTGNSATGIGLNIGDSELDDFSGLEVDNSDLSGNDVAVANQDGDDTLDAAKNYWGATDPDFNSKASGDVEYTPWYATPDLSEDAEVLDSSSDTRAYSGTIQGGVDAANSDDTVEISEGTYDKDVENFPITLDKSVDLRSTSGSEDTLVNVSDQDKLAFEIKSDNVEITGFNITLASRAIESSGYSHIHLEDVIANRNLDKAITFNNGEYFALRDVKSYGNNGTFGDNEGPSSSEVDGITFWQANHTDLRNVVSYENGDNGIYFNGENHTLVNAESYGNGDQGVDISSDYGMTGGAEVINVTSYNNLAEGIEVQDDDVGVNIQDSELYKNGRAGLNVTVHKEYNHTPDAQVKINDSLIYSNGVGVAAHEDVPKVEAEYNYWGAASGPEGQGDSVSGDVDYDPWLLEEDGERYDVTGALVDSDWYAFSPNVPVKSMEVSNGSQIDSVSSTPVSVLGYNGESNWTSVGEVNMMDGMFIHDDAEAIGIKQGSSQEISRSLKPGWNLVGAYANGDKQQVNHVFSPVEASLSSIAYPDRNLVNGTVLNTDITEFSSTTAGAPTAGAFWLRASGDATLSTTPNVGGS